MMRYVAVVAALTTLAACGEKPQTLALPKSDSSAHTGPASAFTAPGWKTGDKVAWEQHLKARQQNSQNDYSKMN
jgi:predicted small lipoprotein YifL